MKSERYQAYADTFYPEMVELKERGMTGDEIEKELRGWLDYELDNFRRWDCIDQAEALERDYEGIVEYLMDELI